MIIITLDDIILIILTLLIIIGWLVYKISDKLSNRKYYKKENK